MLMLFLCGCSLFNPYIDRRRNPGVSDIQYLYSGPSKPEAPVICHNPLLTDDDELQKMADEECVKNETGDRAVFIKKTYLSGKLLLPSHAHYVCVKGNQEVPTQAQMEEYIENADNVINNQIEDEELEEEDDEFIVRE